MAPHFVAQIFGPGPEFLTNAWLGMALMLTAACLVPRLAVVLGVYVLFFWGAPPRLDREMFVRIFVLLAGGYSLRNFFVMTITGKPTRFLGVHPNAHDWSRRLARTPAREGWNAGVLFRWKLHALRGAWAGAKLGKDGAARFRLLAFCAGHCAGVTVSAFGTLLFAWEVSKRAVMSYANDGRRETLVLVVTSFVCAWIGARLAGLLAPRGWRHAHIAFERFVHHEYWPTWAWYSLIAPGIALLALKHRSLCCWLACNPGIPAGGGLVGESKAQILRALGASPMVARWGIVHHDAQATHEQILAAVHTVMRDAHLAYPVILKPDVGERGRGVTLCANDAESLAALAHMHGDCMVQQYHPGPVEVGVMWVRFPKDSKALPPGVHVDTTNSGFIYSITRKEFPVLTGDGIHTLEELIETHPRFRRQHRVFLARFVHETSRVPGAGEHIALGTTGNHSQGALFADGVEYITPELTRAIDDLAKKFAGGLDFGRFDIRAASEDDIRRGGLFAIVELNGTGAESTNIYDPERSLAWALRVLFGQWKLLGALGSERIAAGAPRPTLRTLIRILRAPHNAKRL